MSLNSECSSTSVDQIAQKLEEAVLSQLNPLVDNGTRAQAYHMMEQITHELSVSVPCGFLLSVHTRPALVRHYGLHLLETAIKYRWDTLADQDKSFIKEHTMKLMVSGTKDILEEEHHIKDKVSRLVVELAKRMWPQLWPSLLVELRTAAETGLVQLQMVLMTLTRMSEDVATLKTMECTNRRRDLYQALTANMTDLFNWLMMLLQQHYAIYSQARQAGADKTDTVVKQHAAVIQDVLVCLASYVEWVSMNLIFVDSAKLLQSFCFLLEDDFLRHGAAQCLLVVVSRKGSIPERLQLVSLFHSDYLGPVYNAALTAVKSGAADSLDSNYAFLKTLVQVVMHLGLQLTALWGKEPTVVQPETFKQYLFILLAFGEHPSLSVYSHVNSAWTALLRHAQASTSGPMQEAGPQWLKSVMERVTIHGYPSDTDSPTSRYSRLDYDDCDDEYAEAFYQTRCEIGVSFRLAAPLWPALVWAELESRTFTLLQLPAPQLAEGTNIVTTPLFKQWEALSTLLEWAMKSVSYHQSDTVSPERGVQLLGRLVQYQCHEPRLLSVSFSCISALFPFIVHQPVVLTEVFNKILDPLVAYSTCKDVTSPLISSRPMNELRKHCACLVNKLAKNYPDIMLPGFQMVVDIVRSLNESANPPIQMNRIHLQDALLAINNAKVNYLQQAEYIGTVLKPVTELFNELKEVINSPSAFMSYTGLDKEPADARDPQNDVVRNNRFNISYSLKLIDTVVKRSAHPKERHLQEAGGFVISSSEGEVIVRNPCMEHVAPLLHPLFALVRTCNSLWKPECLAALSPSYAKAHAQPRHEKEAVIGHKPLLAPSAIGVHNAAATQSTDDSEKSSLEWTQNFLHLLHENWTICMSDLCQCCDPRLFYATDNLALYTIQAPLDGLQHMPDYRLRPVVRVFCRAWLGNCPPSKYDTLLRPVMMHFASFMSQHLEQRWEVVGSVDVQPQQQTEEDDRPSPGLESPECAEIVEALLVRLLNRDYLEFLRLIFIKHNLPSNSTNSVSNDASDSSAQVNGVVSEAPESVSSNGQSAAVGDELTAAGECLLSCETLGPIMAALLRSISWPDSVSSMRACSLVSHCVKFLALRASSALGPDDYCAVLRAFLSGLQVHGQHLENLQLVMTSAVLCYTALRPLCDALPQVLASIPGASMNDINTLDKLVASSPVTNTFKNSKIEKQKKELLKKIVSPVIGISVSEALKHSVQLSVLPPLFSSKQRRGSNNLVLDDREADIGLTNLFASFSAPPLA